MGQPGEHGGRRPPWPWSAQAQEETFPPPESQWLLGARWAGTVRVWARGHFLEGDWGVPWGDLGPFWSCRVLGALVLGPQSRVNPGSRPGQSRDRSDGLAFKFPKQPLVEARPLLLQLSAWVGSRGVGRGRWAGSSWPPRAPADSLGGRLEGLCGWAEFRRKSCLHWRGGAFWWGGLYTGLTEVL